MPSGALDEQPPAGLQEAIDWAERAVAAAPTDAKVYRGFAQMYWKQGQLASAAAILSRGLKACADPTILHEQLGELCWLRGEWLESYSCISQCNRSISSLSVKKFILSRALGAW